MIYRRIIVVYRVSLRTSVISLVRWEGVYVWQTFEAEEYVLITILSSPILQLLIVHPATMNFQVDSLRCLGQRLEGLGTTSGC